MDTILQQELKSMATRGESKSEMEAESPSKSEGERSNFRTVRLRMKDGRGIGIIYKRDKVIIQYTLHWQKSMYQNNVNNNILTKNK